MRHVSSRSRLAVLAAAAVGAGATIAHAEPFLTPNDFIIAIDGVGNSTSSYPPMELPAAVIDGDLLTKYLNFGKRGTGLIVQPGASTTVRSFQLGTANDFVNRDPASYSLWGTNSAIASGDNSDGLGEPWTLISNGALNLPLTRNVLGPVVDLTNNTAYNAYKLYFPDLRNAGAANSMQFSEVQFYDQTGAAGNALLNPLNDIRAIDNPGSDSAYPAGELPSEAIDGSTAPASKYLNFAREGTGLIITPSRGQSILNSFQLWTANDVPGRDPSAYEIYGTNAAIASVDNSFGDAESWTLISSGSVMLPDDRNTAGPVVSFANATPYTSYKIIFPDNKGPDDGPGVDSIQISELVFDGILFGEPVWNVNGGGNWHHGPNWIGPVPNGVGAVARFLGASTAAQTIYSDIPVTVGTLRFDNANTYVIAGAGVMTIDVASGSGAIQVLSGLHKINLPLVLNDNTTADVASSATLVIADPLDLNGRTLTKTGSGVLNIISTVTGGSAPATINVAGGQAQIDFGIGTPATPSTPASANVSLVVSGSKASFGANQNLRGLDAVTANAGDQEIDLAGSQVRVYPVDRPAEELSIYNDIRSARLSASGKDGIYDSTSPGAGFAIGVTDQATDAHGDPHVLARLTRQGDATVDGLVSLPDFNRLAANFGTSGALWDQGDFNFDGIVNLQDFNLLAGNFGLQAGPDGPSPEDWAALGSAVPEPAGLSALGLLALAANPLGRRYRKLQTR